MHFERGISSLFFLTLLSLAGFGVVAAAPVRVSLWPEGAPVGVGEEAREELEVIVTIYQPAEDQAKGTAMIICPGGGYGGLMTEGEGHGIAKWLNGHGVTGVVLEYRLPKQRPFVPWLDASRALRTVRARAGEWGIQPDRIGIIGFSAGGHLAATALTHFDQGDPAASDPIARVSSRPDFGILVYPVVSMGELGHRGSRNNLLGPDPSEKLVKHFSSHLQVKKSTPPVFLAHALDDGVVVPENSRVLHYALRDQGVSTRLLELPSGGHGLNGYKGPMWDAWQKQSLEWLQELKLLK